MILGALVRRKTLGDGCPDPSVDPIGYNACVQAQPVVTANPPQSSEWLWIGGVGLALLVLVKAMK